MSDWKHEYNQLKIKHDRVVLKLERAENAILAHEMSEQCTECDQDCLKCNFGTLENYKKFKAKK